MDALGTGFDTLLTRGALAALGLAVAWSLAVVVAVVLEVHTHGRVRVTRHTGCPRAARLWLLAGFTVVLTGIAPAQASDQAGDRASDRAGDRGSGTAVGPAPGHPATPRGDLARDTVAGDLDGLALPDRTVDRRAQPRHATSHPPHHLPSHALGTTDVVVVRGDSLWRIAQERLPRHADDAAIATAVARLHAANRSVIGPDPDRIEPGQHLVFPAQSIHPEEP